MRFDEAEGWDEEGAIADLGDIVTINGSLTIYPGFLYDTTTVVAPKLRNITGEVSSWYSNTTSRLDSLNISLPQLEYVGKAYTLRVGTDKLIQQYESKLHVNGPFRIWDSLMTDVDVGSLTEALGGFSIDQNPALTWLAAGDLTTVKGYEMSIKSNDVLFKIDFRNLTRAEVQLGFEYNPELEEIELPKLEYARSLYFYQNGRQPTLSLPRLVQLGNENTTGHTSSYYDLVKIEMDVLSHVSGHMEFQDNMFADLVLPSLSNLTGTLTVTTNQVLGTLAFPRLQNLGDLVAKRNVLLKNVTFNSLKTVDSIDMTGNFTNVEFFGLEEVTGDFKVQGDPSMDCWYFDENFFQKIVKGSYSCVGNHTKPDGERGPSTESWGPTEGSSTEETPADEEGNQSSTPSPDDSGGGLSTGAKAGIGVGVSVGAIVLLAALAFLWRRRKRSTETQQPRLDQASTQPAGHEKSELDATSPISPTAPAVNRAELNDQSKDEKTSSGVHELAPESRVHELA